MNQLSSANFCQRVSKSCITSVTILMSHVTLSVRVQLVISANWSTRNCSPYETHSSWSQVSIHRVYVLKRILIRYDTKEEDTSEGTVWYRPILLQFPERKPPYAGTTYTQNIFVHRVRQYVMLRCKVKGISIRHLDLSSFNRAARAPMSQSFACRMR